MEEYLNGLFLCHLNVKLNIIGITLILKHRPEFNKLKNVPSFPIVISHLICGSN